MADLREKIRDLRDAYAPVAVPFPRVRDEREFLEECHEHLPAILDAADEACRFYRADGSHEELPAEEVKRRRIEAAKRLADYDRAEAVVNAADDLLSYLGKFAGTEDAMLKMVCTDDVVAAGLAQRLGNLQMTLNSAAIARDAEKGGDLSARSQLRAALRRLSNAAQTSGGVAGRDPELYAAIQQAEKALNGGGDHGDE